MKRWSYSLAMLVLYLALFLFWQQFPSRASFFFGGLAAAGVLTAGMIAVSRRGYFVNSTDRRLHALVILDVVLESLAYEFLLLLPSGAPLVGQLHNTNNFYGCAAAFTVLIGLYRWSVMRRKASEQQPQETLSHDAAAEPALH